MRKKLLGVGLACILLTGSFAGCGTAAESGIELPCYDQSADQNYNPDLFYRNDMTTYSADPSVLWCLKNATRNTADTFICFRRETPVT